MWETGRGRGKSRGKGVAGGEGGWRTLERQRGRVSSKRLEVECSPPFPFSIRLHPSTTALPGVSISRAVSACGGSQIRSATPHNTPLSDHLLPQFPSWNGIVRSSACFTSMHVPTLITDPIVIRSPSIQFLGLASQIHSRRLGFARVVPTSRTL